MPDKAIHAPHEAPASVLKEAGVRPGRDYPEPVVDYRQSRAEALEASKGIGKMKVNSSQ